MIAKAPEAAAKSHRKAREPLDVRLSLKVNFGDTPADAVTVMHERRVPMVNSVFEQRDRIIRAFTMTLLRVGLAQPKVVSEVFPAVKLLRKLKKTVA